VSAARRLADLAEEELAIVTSGRTDALADLHERRSAAFEALPAQLSGPERELLGEVHRLQEQITALLELAVAETAAELARLDRGSAALKGYANSLKHA
jgi:hypothetical protein